MATRSAGWARAVASEASPGQAGHRQPPMDPGRGQQQRQRQQRPYRPGGRRGRAELPNHSGYWCYCTDCYFHPPAGGHGQVRRGQGHLLRGHPPGLLAQRAVGGR